MKRYDPEIDVHSSVCGDYVFYGDVEALVEKLREYLAFDSTDGRKERRVLRAELSEMIK